jgi:hypothetical protein
MDMAELKTKLTRNRVQAFLNKIPDEGRRRDAFTVLDLMQKATRTEPAMWGNSIVGFGSYHYKYASGHEGDMPLISFSPRKQNLTLYSLSGVEGYAGLLRKLGKVTSRGSCLYINKLDDVHLPTLREMINRAARSKRGKSAS